MISSPKQTGSITLVPNQKVLDLYLASWLSKRPDRRAVVAPAIHVLSSWVEESAVLIRQLRGMAVPGTLRSSHAKSLWQRAVRDTGSVVGHGAVSNAAREAQSAWTLMSQWGVHEASEWLGEGLYRPSTHVTNYCREHGLFTQEDWYSDLADLLKDAVDHEAVLPGEIELVGFVEMTAAEEKVFAALRGCGVTVESAPAPEIRCRSSVCKFEEMKQELAAAVSWAAATTRNSSQRVALVVPTSKLSDPPFAREIKRYLDEQFESPSLLALNGENDIRFHFGSAYHVSEFPAVSDALMLLELSIGGLAQRYQFHRISRYLLSPFWGYGELQPARRAAVERGLRNQRRFWLSIRDVADSVSDDLLRAEFRELPGLGAPVPVTGRRRPMAADFRDCLERWGWPGKSGMDPACQQAVAQLLGHIEELDVIEPIDTAEALNLLADACSDATVACGGGVLSPLQVVTPETALGGQFDAVWALSMDSETWPPSMSSHSLLPAGARSEIPRMNPQGHTAYYRRMTQALSQCASEVRFSWSAQGGDGPRGPSPLLAQIDAEAFEPDEVVGRKDSAVTESQRFAEPEGSCFLESVEVEERLPFDPSDNKTIPGGSGFFRAQAACPLAATLQYRLDVSFRPPPGPFPGADLRGIVLHRAIEALYRSFLGRAGVPGHEDVEQAVSAALAGLEKSRVYDNFVIASERVRLDRLLHEWLEFESHRTGFCVAALEERLQLTVGKHGIDVRIDRRDRLVDGRSVLIDYKSSERPTAGKWLKNRIQEPQLPLYAVLLDKEKPGSVSGAAFARLVPGKCRYDGFSDDPESALRVPGAAGSRLTVDSWSQMLQGWHGQIETLYQEIVDGVADNVVYDSDMLAWSEVLPILRIEHAEQWLQTKGSVNDC